MDFDKLDPDFFTRHGAYTKQIYRDVYPAIDPASPALSQSGKVVVVTGAGSGIGALAIVPAFAKAGARAVVLVGRRRDRIQETASAIRKQYPATEVMEAPTDIGDAEAVEALFVSVKAKFGSPDVLVNNAGVQSQVVELATSDPLKWWTDFEINVRGTYLATRMFLKMLGTDKQGTVISLTSGASTVPMSGMSSYGTSKVVVNRLAEYLAIENPHVTAITLNPGIVATEAMTDQFRKFALDTFELVGGTAVWLATKQAAFLNGRYVSVGWSVDELVARKDEILAGSDLKMTLQGKFGVESL